MFVSVFRASLYVDDYKCRCPKRPAVSEPAHPLELQSQAALYCLLWCYWVLRTEHGASIRRVPALNHLAISPALDMFLNKKLELRLLQNYGLKEQTQLCLTWPGKNKAVWVLDLTPSSYRVTSLQVSWLHKKDRSLPQFPACSAGLARSSNFPESHNLMPLAHFHTLYLFFLFCF